MNIPLVFMHGSGRTSSDARPHQVAAFPRAVFIGPQGDDVLAASVEGASSKIVAASQQTCVVVAHSFGAIAVIPTLVITGDWNREYAAIAIEPEQAGATRLQLKGHGHRVQNHPAFNQTITRFAAAL